MAKYPHIKRMSTGDLRPADYNPREISDEALEGLGKSLDRFGVVEPLVFNKRTKTLVGGHQRLRVLLDRGITEVDVVVVNLDRIEEKALNITLNNPEITGDFTDGLQTILGELAAYDDAWMSSLCLDALVVEPGAEPEIHDLELGEVSDFFWISIRGPLKGQAETLERLKKSLAGVDRVELEIGTVKV